MQRVWSTWKSGSYVLGLFMYNWCKLNVPWIWSSPLTEIGDWKDVWDLLKSWSESHSVETSSDKSWENGLSGLTGSRLHYIVCSPWTGSIYMYYMHNPSYTEFRWNWQLCTMYSVRTLLPHHYSIQRKLPRLQD